MSVQRKQHLDYEPREPAQSFVIRLLRMKLSARAVIIIIGGILAALFAAGAWVAIFHPEG